MNYLQKNIEITHLSNFKTPAVAEYYFEITSENDIKHLSEIFDFATLYNLSIVFIGGGTNMLFAFDKFEGIVIKNSLQGWNYDEETKILETYSNENIWEIAESLENDFGQDLWHRFIGLPGSVGGAIFGNAGCFGLETENNFKEARVYNKKTGNIEIVTKADCDFSYRSSIFKKTQDYFIISAIFDLSKKIEKYHSDVDNIYFREHKQPKGNTCGSFFKNPSVELSTFCSKYPEFDCSDLKVISAGFLIEKAGLKGYKIGGAFMSDKHANFLMHDGTGNYKDLLDLIRFVQQTVKDKFGVLLEPEVRMIFNTDAKILTNS